MKLLIQDYKYLLTLSFNENPFIPNDQSLKGMIIQTKTNDQIAETSSFMIQSGIEILDDLMEDLDSLMYPEQFYYIGVPEYDNNNKLHYHILLNEIPNQLLQNNTLTGWNFGNSKIQSLNSNNINDYLLKYILKRFTSSTEELNSLLEWTW